MNTQSTAIAQLAAALAENPKVEQDVKKEISRNSLVSYLLSMRVAKGITQDQIAESMGCDPSKISRLESGNDTALKWVDIAGYAGALNVNMCILFEDPALPAADRIKECVFRIHDHLDQLTTLAEQVGGNDEIAKKIHQFSGEVLLNFLMRYKDHSEKLRAVIKLPSSAKVSIGTCEAVTHSAAEEPVGT